MNMNLKMIVMRNFLIKFNFEICVVIESISVWGMICVFSDAMGSFSLISDSCILTMTLKVVFFYL